jgi:O-antigen/teichoic acid export membrane protein
MWGLNSLDRLFLVHYTNLAAIGIYAFAYSSGYLVIQMLVNPIYIMYPSAAAELHNRGERTAAQQLFEDCIRLMCALTIPAIAGIAILAGPLVKLVATDAFSAAAPLIGFITAGYLLSMLASYCEITLGLINRQYWSTIAIMIAVVVNVFLNLWLIPIYTIKGAAVATMVSFAAQFAISVSVARYYNVARFPFARLVPILAASAVMAVAVQIVHRRLVATTALFDLAVSIFTGVVVYAALVVPLRIVDRAIVHDVALWLRRGRAGATP